MAEINLFDINRSVLKSPEALIEESEKSYRSLVDGVADRICSDKNVRILLVAGPSGSGKTTTANLISDKIKLHGEDCIVVSLDDFYRNNDDPNYPTQPDGSRDLEAAEALDIEAVTKTLMAIAESREFMLPKYDFKVSRRVEERLHTPMPNGCVIIEGLHALNPMIFSKLPKEKCLKLFISVSTNINDGGVRILSGRKIRFVRRMVRDSIYRNADAEKTLSLWKNVLLGEDKYLYPNRKYADITFDTFHSFELSAMRGFAEKLISESLAEKDGYAGITLAAMKKILPLDISLIPEDSLIREFIPGGKYESAY